MGFGDNARGRIGSGLRRFIYNQNTKGATDAGFKIWEDAARTKYESKRESKRTASQSLAAPAGDNAQPKSLGEPASPYRGGYTDSDGGDGLGSTPSGKRKRASQMLGG